MARQGVACWRITNRSRDEAEAAAAEIRAPRRRLFDGARRHVGRCQVPPSSGRRSNSTRAARHSGEQRRDDAIHPHDQLDDVTDEVWHRIMDVNVKGPFQCIGGPRRDDSAAAAGT